MLLVLEVDDKLEKLSLKSRWTRHLSLRSLRISILTLGWLYHLEEECNASQKPSQRLVRIPKFGQ